MLSTSWDHEPNNPLLFMNYPLSNILLLQHKWTRAPGCGLSNICKALSAHGRRCLKLSSYSASHGSLFPPLARLVGGWLGCFLPTWPVFSSASRYPAFSAGLHGSRPLHGPSLWPSAQVFLPAGHPPTIAVLSNTFQAVAVIYPAQGPAIWSELSGSEGG